MVLFILSITIILGFLSFASLSNTIRSFPENAATQKQKQQQFMDLVAVSNETRQSGILQSISSERNLSDKEEDNDGSTSPRSLDSDLDIDAKNTNNWMTVNHDIYGTRHSNQTIINKDNVATLHVKWILINDHEIQEPPIIIGNKGYVQDYAGTVIAFDAGSGRVLWKVKLGNGPTMGLTYSNAIVYAATAYNDTVVAINATDGKTIWESETLGNPRTGYNIPSFPIVWKDYVIVGSAGGGDVPNGVGTVRGNITALNGTSGKIIWNLHTTTGEWVNPRSAPDYNSGANDWSGGSLDPETGIVYIPLGSPSPNFNASTRQTPNFYSNHMIAVNITNGKMIWATPFVADGTVLNVRVPDTHDWDTSWGSSISKVTFDNGTQKKIVIGHDKMGNVIAMDAATGKEIWWKTLGKQYNIDAIPSPTGSGMIWSYGVDGFHAVDNSNKTLYIAATNRGVNIFTNGISGYKIPAPHTIEQGLRNGTVVALDLITGKIKWQYQTEFPPRVSPLVTGDIVFAGYIPFTEKAKTSSTTHGIKTQKAGVILALDKETGKKLWEFNVNAPIGDVGPSVGDGMLFVPTGKIEGLPREERVGGSVVAFGPP
ncbi:MAG TPA: PQQ-binding-like beta-propeller repeat protein [Nitrososphaeraceae archaeon]